jgi:hypothetical protein
MSLAETQEIMAVLQEIMAMLEGAGVKVDEVTEKVTGKTREGGVSGGSDDNLSMRREMRVMNMYMVAMQRFTGSDTLSQIANKIQSVTAATMRLMMFLRNVQLIQTAISLGKAVTPLGWLELGANAVGLGMSLTTLGQ